MISPDYRSKNTQNSIVFGQETQKSIHRSHGLQVNLDTLGQLDTNPVSCCNSKYCKSKQRDKYKRRALAKVINTAFIYDLIDLKNENQDKYWDTWHCSNRIDQDGRTLKSKYCGNRWCVICNRIRTAKAINHYKPEFEKMKDPQFVTLTQISCKESDLKDTIDFMIKDVGNIVRNGRSRYGLDIKALRSLECNYNEEKETYNPHFHILVDGEEVANFMKDKWVKQRKHLRDPKQQVIKTADENSFLELVKYCTKFIGKDGKFNAYALDKIYIAMKGRRLLQPIGIKKHTPASIEEIEGIQSQEVDFLDEGFQSFTWDKESADWVSPDGEVLADFEPTRFQRELIEKINNQKPIDYENEGRNNFIFGIDYKYRGHKDFERDELEKGIRREQDKPNKVRQAMLHLFN